MNGRERQAAPNAPSLETYASRLLPNEGIKRHTLTPQLTVNEQKIRRFHEENLRTRRAEDERGIQSQ